MPQSERQVCPACGFAFEPAGREGAGREFRSILDSEEMSVYPSSAFAEAPRVPPDPVLLALGDAEPGRRGESGDFAAVAVGPAADTGAGSFDFLRLGAHPRIGRSTDDAIRGNSTDDSAHGLSSRWSGLLLAVLLSYASATTLALAWYVVLPKLRGKKSGEDGPATASHRGDAGLCAGKSRRVAPTPVVADEHRTSLGRPLTVGSLEITPLDVARRSIVMLRNRVTGGVERREDLDKLLVLRLRLRNVSNDTIFAPFDETFVREREDGMTESFVEFGPNARVYPFPLARESEWSIEGQSFRELKPGETLETLLVTSIEGGRLEAETLFWRVKLRVGIDATQVVGVTTDGPPR